MSQGKLLAIGIASDRAVPVETFQQAEVIIGQGLVGDRYTESTTKDPGKQVTFIEQEALEAIAVEYEVQLSHTESRRNLLTSGVPLNHLVGAVFQVGDAARFRGLRLCEPCSYLEDLTGKAAKTPLKHRGGLRTEVVQGGTIQVGDKITRLEE